MCTSFTIFKCVARTAYKDGKVNLFPTCTFRGIQRQFLENICSEDDLRSEIFEKVSFDPYNFRITRRSARKSEQVKNF